MIQNLTVIKIGGSLLETGNFEKLVKALAPKLKKQKAVIVHGGGKEVTRLAERLGIKNRFVKGRRFTDDSMMSVVEMVLSGKVNPHLVGRLNALGVRAVGLSGRDGGIVCAKAVAGLGRVGLPSKVKTQPIQRMLSHGDIPVFSSVASDGGAGALNVNADEMACALAMALKARRLILFTDVPGILDSSKRTISRINEKSAIDLIRKGVITGGMIPKVLSAIAAIKKGVREILILQGKLPLAKAKGTSIVRV